MADLVKTIVFGDMEIGGSVGGAFRVAYCSIAAPADTKLDMHLDTDGTGILVEVNCSVIGGGTLDNALPLLADGDLVPVVKINDTWYAWNLFHPGGSSSSSSTSSSSSSSLSSSSQSSSSSLSSSSQSSSSQSSSSSSAGGDSTSPDSTSPDSTKGGTKGRGISELFDIALTEEERQLTYKEFINKRVSDFYEYNPNIFDNKTNEEKEEIILKIVSEGSLLSDVAIRIAIREGLDVE
jgi:hypothetical protein